MSEIKNYYYCYIILKLTTVANKNLAKIKKYKIFQTCI